MSTITILQKNINKNAFIAQEIERRLLEHSLDLSLSKKLDILRDCTEPEILSGKLLHPDASVDVVIANLVLLWQPNFLLFFQEMRRILKENGLLLFSTLGAEKLPTFEKLGDELLTLSFEKIVMEREIVELSYDDNVSLENEVAESALQHDFVETVEEGDGVTLVLDVIYGCAIKTTKPSSTAVEIPLEKITLRNVT